MAYPLRGWRVAGSWLSQAVSFLSDGLTVFAAALALFAGGAMSRGDDGSDNVVLDFTATWCGPCQQMSPIVHRLQQQGYAIRKIDIDKQKSLAQSFRINSIPTFVLVVNGEERTRISGLTSEEQLRRLALQARPAATSVAANPAPPATIDPQKISFSRTEDFSPDEEEEIPFGQPPSDIKAASDLGPAAANSNRKTASGNLKAKRTSIFSRPKKDNAAVAERDRQEETPIFRGQPGETEASSGKQVSKEPLAASVRIRVADETGSNFGSGTIIDSRVGRTCILTCGHIFRPQNQHGKDSAGPKTVEVDIFLRDGRHETYVGKVLDFDLEGDVGVVTIPTAGVLPMTPLAPPADAPAVNASLVSIGCGGGENPAAEPVRLTALNRYDGPDNIECSGVPMQGRSGGGLFDGHGQLVGVCIAADQEGRRGLYAAMPPIQTLLTRAGLKHVLPPTPSSAPVAKAEVSEEQPTAPPATAAKANDKNAVFDEAFQEFDRAVFSDGKTPSAAELSDLLDAAPDAEVICIVRSKEGNNRVVILNQPSTKFVSYLLDSVDQQRTTAPQNASLRVEDVQDPLGGAWVPDDDATGVPKRAATRPSPRRSRFGSRSAD